MKRQITVVFLIHVRACDHPLLSVKAPILGNSENELI